MRWTLRWYHWPVAGALTVLSMAAAGALPGLRHAVATFTLAFLIVWGATLALRQIRSIRPEPSGR